MSNKTSLKLFVIILFIFYQYQLFSLGYNDLKSIKSGYLELGFSYDNSSSYYDSNGDVIIELTDSSLETPKNYTLQYKRAIFTLSGVYKFTEEFSASLELPFCYHSLEELYKMENLTEQELKSDYSLFQPLYFGLGATYQLFDGNFSSYVTAKLRIPPSFHDGIVNDSSYNYLSDGALEALIGASAYYDFKKSWLGFEVLYNARAEELSDQLLLNIEAGLRTVENTYLESHLKIIDCLEGFSEDYNLIPEKSVLQEDRIMIGFGFGLKIKNLVNTVVSYDVTLAGINTWKSGFFQLRVGLFL